MNITVDYDGPSLSDTSSLVSLEYGNRNSSGSSLSLSFGSAACTQPEDDIITVSSRDTGLLVQKTKTVMNGGGKTTSIISQTSDCARALLAAIGSDCHSDHTYSINHRGPYCGHDYRRSTRIAVWAPFDANKFGPHVVDAVRSLAEVQNLKQLTVGNKCGPSRQLPDLCETVARMPSLKRLKHIDWTYPKASRYTIPDSLRRLSPCSKLTDIDFEGKAGKSSAQYLRRLFQPCKDYPLKILTLRGYDLVNEEHGTEDNFLPLAIRPAHPHIKTLTITIGTCLADIEGMYDIFPFCTKLRSLKLRFLIRSNVSLFLRSEYSLLLPNSLEELHMTPNIEDMCRNSTPCPAWSPSLTQARSMKKERHPVDPSAVFEQLKLSESSKPIERNTQWLRDQMSRAINGIVTPESVVSDGSSLALSGDDLDAQSPFDGDLALQQDSGRYYYMYTSGSLSFAASASAAHDDVRQLVPPACTDCSVCGVLLDAFRYVCSTCGRYTPHPRTSTGANGHANSYTDGKGKARADVVDVSMFDPLAYHRAHTRTASRSPRARACCPLPSAPSASFASSSSTVAGDGGYELCPGCFETGGCRARRAYLGLAGGPAHAEPAAACGAEAESPLPPCIPREAAERLGVDRCRLDGAERDNISEYTICNTSLTAQRYKCASCKDFVLCRACYSQVHEVHPSHAFLGVPDRPHRSRSEPDLELTNNLNDDGLGDECKPTNTSKCQVRPALAPIVRFCESVDICSNYEAAGLPGNLDADDGGYNTSHIMIKHTPSRCVRADSLREADAVTIIGSGSKHARGGRCDRKALDLRIACKGCNQSNIGVRFQCATCPATKTQSYSLLPRPVDRPIESQFAILPILYRQSAGPAGRLNSSHPKGEWFRCMYSAKDLFDVCENLNPHAHDFFYVFKAPVDMQVFRIVAELDKLKGSPPVLKYPVYYS
ncbi:hypothetical protein DFH11DRAFT_1772461 [Phellopilus nigrolimitatus]|nr:hypothetical protein DFH11DRAFT_1772461 [Phellopilus nigrolimitatus]